MDEPGLEIPKRTDGRPRLAVLLTTKDEERHVEACLASVESIADGIVTVDSFSTDRTRELAARFGAVWEHEFLGSAAQKNWAIPRIDADWILVIDADERLSPELAAEIRSAVDRSDGTAAYRIRRVQRVLGAPVRFSGWGSDAVTRLFRAGKGRYPDRRVHADLDVDGSVGTLRAPMEHLTFESFAQYLPKVAKFALWGGAQAFRDGKRCGAATILSRSIWRFVRTYVFQLGFADGVRGAIVCGLQAYGTFLKWGHVAEWTLAERRGAPLVGMPEFEDQRRGATSS